MTRRKYIYIVFILLAILLFSNALFYLLVPNNSNGDELRILIESIKKEVHTIKSIEKRLDLANEQKILIENTDPVAILLIAYNRPEIKVTIESILKSRDSLKNGKDRFPLFVSQDGSDPATKAIIDSYTDKLYYMTHNQTRVEEIPSAVRSNWRGYYILADHYKFALDELLLHKKYQSVIIFEDDLQLSPDIISYFDKTLPILKADPTLYCVSAWNDNGKSGLYDSSKPGIVYRSDFFPGLGWMLLRSLWLDIREKWPRAFWDEFMREPEIRRSRSCLRPEISRSKTFGRVGVSKGQFYDDYLQYIEIYQGSTSVEYNLENLADKAAYDEILSKRVYSDAQVLQRIPMLHNLVAKKEYRIEYGNIQDFVRLAKQFGVMSDTKRGVPRTAYLGIVTFFYKGSRIFLAPQKPWTGYIES